MLMMGFRRIICEPPAAIGASGQRSLSPRTVSAHSRRVLPAVAAQTEKVGPVKRTLPRLLHTRPREGLSLLCRHAPAPASRNPPPPAARSPSPRSLAIDAGSQPSPTSGQPTTAPGFISPTKPVPRLAAAPARMTCQACVRCCFVCRPATAWARRARRPDRFGGRWQDRLLVYQ